MNTETKKTLWKRIQDYFLWFLMNSYYWLLWTFLLNVILFFILYFQKLNFLTIWENIQMIFYILNILVFVLWFFIWREIHNRLFKNWYVISWTDVSYMLFLIFSAWNIWFFNYVFFFNLESVLEFVLYVIHPISFLFEPEFKTISIFLFPAIIMTYYIQESIRWKNKKTKVLTWFLFFFFYLVIPFIQFLILIPLRFK